MDSNLKKWYRVMKARGLSPETEAHILEEIRSGGSHQSAEPSTGKGHQSDALVPAVFRSFYVADDPCMLQNLMRSTVTALTSMRSLDELLERDRQREKDGFPRKIRVGRLVKPSKGGKDKVVVVPTTVEEKFIHDNSFRPPDEESGQGGSGEGEEGEVIGEQPIRPQDQAGTGPGEGESGGHEIESNAYDLGRILTEKFELPNLKDKGKKRSLTRYTYDMTDKNQGFGQILDKKATLKRVVETNMNLGNLPDVGAIDSTQFLIAPQDLIYRVLSREKDYESQAMVFFLRDYSGSMMGKPTELVVSQHVLIYSWLLYQYERQVETRFILHDTDAKEAPDFHTYYNSKVAGGTRVASAYRLVCDIVKQENLTRDYNIYVFHGTDGDDWDKDGKETVPVLKEILSFAARAGITVAQRGGAGKQTEVEKYIRASGLLDEKPDLLRMDVMGQDADEPRLIEGIKKLIS